MKKELKRILILSCLAIYLSPFAFSQETPASLATQFVGQPADTYKAGVFWHWMGTMYNREGITKDLEAMKAVGLNSAFIFNAPLWLDPDKTLYPQNTYRSEAYWDAVGFALSEAGRLNMEIGLHNCPGWSTTGGPWIDPETDGMKAATFSTTSVSGGKKINIDLPLPKGDFYKDVAVYAVAKTEKPSQDGIVDVTDKFSKGKLDWDTPQGEWTIYRFGYFSTMQNTHPTPEEVQKTSFESDKMSVAATVKHWNNMIKPLTERFKPYIGNTFKYLWIDSYEAWGQSWTPDFREKFIEMKGYDPVPQIIMAHQRGDNVLDDGTKGLKIDARAFQPESQAFLADYKEVTNRLFQNCWRLGAEMLRQAGFKLIWEPYGSIIAAPFDMKEAESIPDVPATEFWLHSREPSGGGDFAQAAARYNKRVVAAEAFTGMEAVAWFNETPAMLKRPADMAFNYGVNKFVLHSWALNPLPDKYLPGWAFAHYGTHFGRTQTWHEASKAVFTYFARCQMLLQQGTFVERDETVLHRRTPDMELFFVRNNGKEALEKDFSFSVTKRVPEIWNAYTGKIYRTDYARTDNNCIVKLKLEKDESVFVVFPSQPTAIAETCTASSLQNGKAIDLENGGWVVNFFPKTADKPFKRVFSKLIDWATSLDKNIKYFSGTAVYGKDFELKTPIANQQFILDLGNVKDLAEVELNGQKVAALWVAPFRVNITNFVKEGVNSLKIKVTNTWQNAMIGDEQYPRDFDWAVREWNNLPAMTALPDWVLNDQPRPERRRKTFIPWFYYDKNSPLEVSGLLGTVSIDVLNNN
ncbi:MAG: hypothetical protein LBS52_09710 [Dysgonamonadaceae bacterium]|jgi:hypothetical protein|nr:hypothetical protein [Dysgonamonadaceae bacterium]